MRRRIEFIRNFGIKIHILEEKAHEYFFSVKQSALVAIAILPPGPNDALPRVLICSRVKGGMRGRMITNG